MIVALLFHSNEPAFAAMDQVARNHLVERHITFNHEVVQPRALLMTNRALQPSTTGRLVWPDGDPGGQEEPSGPGGLRLSGFYLIDCADLDEAEEIARQYPMPPGLGCLEVRPALQDWDYAPSVDLDATTPAQVWERHADLGSWSGWAPWVEQVQPPGAIVSGATGGITLLGGREATYELTLVDEPTLLALTIRLPGADEDLGVQLRTQTLPRGSTRVSHAAEVPRGLLDSTGTAFSGELNAALRHGLRTLSLHLTGPREGGLS